MITVNESNCVIISKVITEQKNHLHESEIKKSKLGLIFPQMTDVRMLLGHKSQPVCLRSRKATVLFTSK